VQTSSPLSGYNIDVPRSFLHADPTLSSLLLETNFWLGPAKIVCGLNMPDHGDMYNLCLISEEEEGKEGQWYTLGDLEKVKKNYESFDKRIIQILDKAKPEDCHVWRLAETPPLERWCSEEGKVVIVGDAPHAMLPYTGMVSVPSENSAIAHPTGCCTMY
jgi:salicylate hydroxylase